MRQARRRRSCAPTSSPLPSPPSLMPAGPGQAMSPQQLADLIAYLKSTASTTGAVTAGREVINMLGRLRPECAPTDGLVNRSARTMSLMAVLASVLVTVPAAAQAPAVPATADHWTISVYTGASPFALRPPASVQHPALTAAHVTDMPDLNIDTVAHPNLVGANGRFYMFFTAKDLSVNKGGIGLAESADGLRWTFRKTVIREPFVLSSPFVFQWQGVYYMVPESYTEHTVRLYRATSFPDRWEYVRDLISGGPTEAFISPTVVQHEQQWYLFTSPSGNDTLRLFVAGDPTGRWTEHPASPVVRNDPHNARPAGRPFVKDGVLYRVAQDCLPTYGLQVFASKVTSLSPTTYAETKVETPLVKASGQGWNRKAMHHVEAHETGTNRWLAAVDALGSLPASPR